MVIHGAIPGVKTGDLLSLRFAFDLRGKIGKLEKMDLLLKDHPYKVFGFKLTKSEPFTDSKGASVWDGVNNKTLLGQFTDLTIAIHFAENVKNSFPDNWRITIENDDMGTSEEITPSEKIEYKNKYRSYKY